MAELLNDEGDNYPFLFSDGSIKLFGQNVTRVKSGNLAIANNITPQRFIGNTNRQVMSAHIPAQGHMRWTHNVGHGYATMG